MNDEAFELRLLLSDDVSIFLTVLLKISGGSFDGSRLSRELDLPLPNNSSSFSTCSCKSVYSLSWRCLELDSDLAKLIRLKSTLKSTRGNFY